MVDPFEFATEAELKAIDAEVKKEVNAAVDAAKAAPIPPMSDLYTDIYTDQSPQFFMRGCDLSVSSGTYGTTRSDRSLVRDGRRLGRHAPAPARTRCERVCLGWCRLMIYLEAVLCVPSLCTASTSTPV